MVFCNIKEAIEDEIDLEVTILILIDGFLQYRKHTTRRLPYHCHNPYFNRWFSAISLTLFSGNADTVSQSLF